MTFKKIYKLSRSIIIIHQIILINDVDKDNNNYKVRKKSKYVLIITTISSTATGVSSSTASGACTSLTSRAEVSAWVTVLASVGVSARVGLSTWAGVPAGAGSSLVGGKK
jgi:hypothetical protein